MKAWPVLFAAAPAVGFLFGVLGEPEVGAPDRAVLPVPSPPNLVHSGLSLSIARQRLAGLGSGIFQPQPLIVEGADGLPVVMAAETLPPPVSEAPLMDVAQAPPPPPPIDIADRFSRDLSAVMRGGEGATLLMVDGSDPYARRSLRRGEAYLDGWRVHEINRSEIVLRKGRSERRIPIMQGAPRPVPIALAPQRMAFAAAPSDAGDMETSPPETIEDASSSAVAAPPQEGEVQRPRRRISRSGRE